MQTRIAFNTSPADASVKTIDETESWGKITCLLNSFPSPDDELMPGVKWGNRNNLYTPAFWKLQYHLTKLNEPRNSHKFGENLIEEVVACLLGGYGLPSELGMLAFKRLKSQGLIREKIKEEDLIKSLSEPFILSGEKKIFYRFFNQKSKYISNFLNRSDLTYIPVSKDIELRNWLLSVKGIGPKTASWITRNWLYSENVAIIDIHIFRAGIIAGFFKSNANVATDYFTLEGKYLEFCRALGVRPSDMDAVIWYNMKHSNRLAINVLKDRLT